MPEKDVGLIDFCIDKRVGFEKRSYDLYIDSQAGVVQPFTVKKPDLGSKMKPAVNINDEEAQALIDELWKVGIRPSPRLLDTSGVVSVMETHLQDLRAIAFNALNVPLTIHDTVTGITKNLWPQGEPEGKEPENDSSRSNEPVREE